LGGEHWNEWDGRIDFCSPASTEHTARGQILALQRDGRAARCPFANFIHHGQPEKETSIKDEQAQAPQALEVESPQEAHVAEVSRHACP
jgi:hypothetical protein